MRSKFLSRSWLDHIFMVVFAVCFSFYICAYAKTVIEFHANGSDIFSAFGPRGVLIVVAASLVFLAGAELLTCLSFKRFLSFVWRYRIVLVCAFVALCTFFELSGSSIGCWSLFLGGDVNKDLLSGIPRTIRSDEWKVMTPFALSQEYTGYSPISEIIRAANTDVTMVYAQPCWAFSTLFRPFLWGYLLFGSAKGLAFFWSGRLAVLFLVSLEFGYYLTHSKQASFAFGLTVAFASTVQWWFAVNGTAELFIFGQGLVLAFSKLLNAELVRFRITWAFCVAWLATAFVLIVYPAWQVTLFWVFLAFAIDILIRRVRLYKQTRSVLKRIVLPIVLSVVFIALFLAISFLPVLDVVKAVSETVYPGQRVDLGGDGLTFAMNSLGGLLGSINGSAQFPNASEASGFFSLAPFGSLIGLCYVIYLRHKSDKFDLLVLLLSLFEIYAFVYAIFGLPEILAKVTLLSHSTGSRVLQVIGYVDFTILLLAATRLNVTLAEGKLGVFAQDTPNKGCLSKQSQFLQLATSIFIAAIFIFLSVLQGNFVRTAFLVFLFGVVILYVLALFKLVLLGKAANLVILALLIALTGVTVNPVQRGISQVTNSPVYKLVSEVKKSDADAVWAGDNALLGQMCITAGAKTVNAVNTYPVLDRWAKLDTDGVNEDVYNTYAHIDIEISEEATFIDSIYPDTFKIQCTLKDLKTIGVKYFLTGKSDLDSFNADEGKATLVAQNGSYYVWEIC